MPAKFLARKYVGQVQFNKGYLDAEQRIPQGNAGVRECTGIEDDDVDTVPFSLVNAVNQFMLGIALKVFELVSSLPGFLLCPLYYVSKRFMAVYFGLTLSQQVEVGTVQ